MQRAENVAAKRQEKCSEFFVESKNVSIIFLKYFYSLLCWRESYFSIFLKLKSKRTNKNVKFCLKNSPEFSTVQKKTC